MARPSREALMYAGHIGFALAAKGFRSSIPLWSLVIAAQLPDWADAAFCAAGVRTSVFGVLTHSIPAVSVLGLLAAAVAYFSTRDRIAAALIGALVLSHMLTDYVTGVKPGWPGGSLIGLGLYGRPVIDFVIETVVVVAGWMLYRSSFPAERRSSREVIAVLVALVAFQLAADIVFATSPGLRKC